MHIISKFNFPDPHDFLPDHLFIKDKDDILVSPFEERWCNVMNWALKVEPKTEIKYKYIKILKEAFEITECDHIRNFLLRRDIELLVGRFKYFEEYGPYVR